MKVVGIPSSTTPKRAFPIHALNHIVLLRVVRDYVGMISSYELSKLFPLVDDIERRAKIEIQWSKSVLATVGDLASRNGTAWGQCV